MPRLLQPDLLITIQPVGVTFSQPVAVTFPNRSGYEPGTEAEIWSLDAGTGQFVVVGTGRVSGDGQRIETVSGGVRATDWHFALPAPPNGSEAADSRGESNPCPAGSEFILNTGALITSFASPWLSMGEAKEMRFIYSSRQAHPEITIPVKMTMPARVPAPKAVAISASLRTKARSCRRPGFRVVNCAGETRDDREYWSTDRTSRLESTLFQWRPHPIGRRTLESQVMRAEAVHLMCRLRW